MKKYFKFVLLLGISLIFITGCVSDLVIPGNDLNSPATEGSSTNENPVGGLGTGKGTLKIYLTDTSGNYRENDSGTYSAVYITIFKIEAHIAGDNDGDKGSWKLLKQWNEGLLVNLKEYEDRSMLLALLELESNKYTQLRLFLMGEEEDAWVVLEEPEESEEPTSIEFLEIPSVYQTGIKLNRPFEIEEGMITKLTIDFDAEKSVVETGNGKFKLKPVIHMTSETYSEEEELPEGSVSGTVSYYDSQDLALTGIEGANVSLSGGEYIFLYETSTEEYGIFIFDNVPVGNCVLNVYTGDYDDYSESIEVKVNEDKVVNVVFLFEEPGVISGSVVDSLTELAISGATVTVILSGGSTYSFDSSADTNESGEFVIGKLPVGTYTLNVFKEGYDEYNDTTPGGIAVTAGGVTDIDEIEIDLIPSTS